MGSLRSLDLTRSDGRETEAEADDPQLQLDLDLPIRVQTDTHRSNSIHEIIQELYQFVYFSDQKSSNDYRDGEGEICIL